MGQQGNYSSLILPLRVLGRKGGKTVVGDIGSRWKGHYLVYVVPVGSIKL
jgi:hypothetical protein